MQRILILFSQLMILLFSRDNKRGVFLGKFSDSLTNPAFLLTIHTAASDKKRTGSPLKND